jgi:DNA-3-methyladenine glycosylase
VTGELPGRALLAVAPTEAAPMLLGAVVVSDLDGARVAVRLAEVEAYAGEGDDPASHAHRGRGRRNAVMFGPPGHAYVYFTYGMHWCVNVVTGADGTGAAVLLRAAAVVEGLDLARQRRRSPRTGQVPADRELARGPARLATVLGVDGRQDGVDLLDRVSPLRLLLADRPPADVTSGPRVGVRLAADRPWRFWLPDAPEVSPYRAAARRPGRPPRVPSPPP